MNGDVKTKIIKRNGEEVTFDIDKIINAITKANEEVSKLHQMNEYQIMAISEKVADQVENSSHAVNVEDIQNMVETGIMEMRGYEVAQKYVRYRFKRELRRKSNTTDDGILSLLDNINEEVNQENSNKNPVINSTQRDYMAGEVSKDLSKRVLLPNEIIRAHEEGPARASPSRKRRKSKAQPAAVSGTGFSIPPAVRREGYSYFSGGHKLLIS